MYACLFYDSIVQIADDPSVGDNNNNEVVADSLPIDIDDVFESLAGDDKEIDAYELKQILDKLIMNNRENILLSPNLYLLPP